MLSGCNSEIQNGFKRTENIRNTLLFKILVWWFEGPELGKLVSTDRSLKENRFHWLKQKKKKTGSQFQIKFYELKQNLGLQNSTLLKPLQALK